MWGINFYLVYAVKKTEKPFSLSKPLSIKVSIDKGFSVFSHIVYTVR